jgi:HD-like signal output (HDOD) protein
MDVDTDKLRRDLIARAEQLTPLPAAVTRLAQVIHDAESSVDEICAIVGQDPVLAASLLREANSAWTGRAEVATLDRAFMLLGRARLLMLAVGGSVNARFQPALPQYGLAKGELWQHAVASSVAASVVREHSHVDPGGETLTAALLHDLAKLVLCDYLDLQGNEDRMRHLPAVTVERLHVHIDHAELGGIISRHWGLPASICDAISLHHTGRHGEVPASAHAVALADAVAHDALGEDHRGFFGLDTDVTESSMEFLGVPPDAWERLIAQTQQSIASLL